MQWSSRGPSRTLVGVGVSSGLALAAAGSWGLGFGFAHYVANTYAGIYEGHQWEDLRWRSLGVVVLSTLVSFGLLVTPLGLERRIGLAALLVGVSLVSYCIGAIEIPRRRLWSNSTTRS